MKHLYVLLTFKICFFCNVYAQPVNDAPCGAIALSVNANLQECTPSQLIQWSGATASSVSNPICGSGTLLDVWYKFVAADNGKINIRTNLPSSQTNDGAMAVYSAASCNGSFAAVDCNDDYSGINPGLNLTGLVAGQTYYLRFWSFGVSTGNYLICLSSPAPTPAAIDPNKRVGINNNFPETNLDINGDLQVRGGDPAIGKILTSVNNTGKAAWRDLSSVMSKKLFKVTMSANQSVNGENRIKFNTKEYDIGNGFDTTNYKYVINDTINSIYQFNVTVTLSTGGVILVYQNSILKFAFSYDHPPSALAYIFELRCLTSNDEIFINIVSPPLTIFSKYTAYGTPIYTGISTFFSGQKIY